MNSTVEQTGEFLKDHDGYLILTHVRPDGDTVAAGPVPGLRHGQDRPCLPNRETTSPVLPLSGGCWPRRIFEPETVVSVDMAAWGCSRTTPRSIWSGWIWPLTTTPPRNFFCPKDLSGR